MMWVLGTHQAGDGFRGFCEFGVSGRSAGGGGVTDAVAKMVVKQCQRDTLEGFGERVCLGQDVDAVPLLFDHSADAAGLAFDALRGPEGSTTVLNAANEVAVAAFLAGRARFTDIHRINAATVSSLLPTAADAASLSDLLALDDRARRRAQALVQEFAQ